MSERYIKLYSLPERLYAESSPLMIAAGNLLKDNLSGNVLAQLKLKNLGERPIKAAKVRLFPLDTAKKPLGDSLVYEYLDLNAGRDAEFGQKTPFPLPNASTRAILAEVIEVVFADYSVWTECGALWEPLPPAEPLEKALGDRELAKQYRLRFGEQAVKGPARHRDLWLCSCGALNRAEEESCHACRRSRDEQLDCDLAALTAAKDERLAAEKAAAEKAAEQAAEQAAALAKLKAERAEKAKARRKKAGKIAALAAAALALCFAAFLLITKVVIPNSQYNKAVALLDAGQYEEAIEAFKALGNYKDAADRVPEAQAAQIEAENAAAYADAEALLAEGRYEEAIAAFEALGGYKDSQDRIAEVQAAQIDAEYAASYEQAEALLAAGEYAEAMAAFRTIPNDYRDAEAQLQHCQIGLAEERFNTGNYADAAAEAGKVDTDKLAEEDRQAFQSKLYGWAEKAEEEKDYRSAFALFDLSQTGDYQDRMQECNQKYLSEPRPVSFVEDSGGYTTIQRAFCSYEHGMVSFELHIRAVRECRYVWNNTGFYSNISFDSYIGTAKKGNSVLTFSIPYSLVPEKTPLYFVFWPSKLLSSESYTGTDWFTVDPASLKDLDKDLYGNPIP